MEKLEFKGTPEPWYAVNFAGYIHIQDEPFYEAIDLLDEDKCQEARYNAQLAATAPSLFRACQSAILELQLIPCKCDPKVIEELEVAIRNAVSPTPEV